MANWFKEEIAQFGETVDASIQKASGELQVHIDKIGEEITKQRTLTKSDIQALIDYAAIRFGESLDTRMQVAKTEIAMLVTDKVTEVRRELTAAADEQKHTALRNASIAIISAIAIGLLSLLYRHFLHGELDLMFVFRAVLGALAVGHFVWLTQHYLVRFFGMNKTQRSVLIVGAQYFGAFRPKGALGHLSLLGVIVLCWLLLNFWPAITAWINAHIAR